MGDRFHHLRPDDEVCFCSVLVECFRVLPMLLRGYVRGLLRLLSAEKARSRKSERTRNFLSENCYAEIYSRGVVLLEDDRLYLHF